MYLEKQLNQIKLNWKRVVSFSDPFPCGECYLTQVKLHCAFREAYLQIDVFMK